MDQVQPALLLHGHFHVAYRAELAFGGKPSTVIGLDGDGSSYDRNVVLLDLDVLGHDLGQRTAGRVSTADRCLLPPSVSADVECWALRQRAGR